MPYFSHSQNQCVFFDYLLCFVSFLAVFNVQKFQSGSRIPLGCVPAMYKNFKACIMATKQPPESPFLSVT